VENNKLEVLSDQIQYLTQLKHLSCHDNELTVLPELKHLTLLEELDVSGNYIEQLPLSVIFLPKLYYCSYGRGDDWKKYEGISANKNKSLIY
jgi:hypothetical protein